MTDMERQAVFNRAQMFNKETSGVSLESLERDNALSWRIKPLAVFDESEE
jgi:hypothetical protein